MTIDTLNGLKTIFDKELPDKFPTLPANEVIIELPTLKDSSSSRQIHFANELEDRNASRSFYTEVFIQLISEGDFVIDIGAALGWYTAVAISIVGPSGRVIAIEPNIRNFKALHHNVFLQKAQSDIHLLNLALGERDGVENLYLDSRDIYDHRTFNDGSKLHVTSVNLLKLDTLLSRFETLPSLVKLTASGAEGKILYGAKQSLGKGWRPTFMLDFWPYALNQTGFDPLELYHTLKTLEYYIYRLDEGTRTLLEVNASNLPRKIDDRKERALFLISPKSITLT
jgi:FkbM family methyltransferase